MIECTFCKIQTKNPKFCSKSCSVAFNNSGKPSKNRIHGKFAKKPCLICGTMSRNTKFCSHKCAWLSKHRKFIQDVENGLFKTAFSCKRLKRYIIEIRGHKCEECKLELWLKKPIPLNLHHIDGDSTNNLPINLQLLCLNCHGLTENYGRKNKNSTRSYRYKPV